MTRVFLFRQPDNRREDFEVGDVLGFLRDQFGARFPSGGRITDMATGRDVTPRVEADIAQLRHMVGPLVVEVFPRVEISWMAVAAILATSTASIILNSIFAQDPPNATARNVQQESPNNGLSERTNQARVNGRIPDIYGHLRSTPDLLAAPYKVFENHVEKEVAYLCVGRGAFEIHDVRDDTTSVSEIAGTSVEVYGPHTSPNSGDAPQLRIGNPIGLPVVTAKRANSVNGQVLQPQDVGRVVLRGMVFAYPSEIRSQDSLVDFAEFFLPGDVISISGAAAYAGTYSYHTPIDSRATFRPEDEPRPTWGEILLHGDLTANWSAGQIVTITNGTVAWAREDGGTVLYASVNGVYLIQSVALSAGPDPVTTLRLDVTGNSSAWAPFRGLNVSAGGTPTLTRPSDAVLYDLSGTYTVTTVTANVLTISNPAGINPDWTVLHDDFGGVSPTLYPVIATTGQRWVGFFTVESPQPITRVISNVVALNGMYKDNGRQQYRTDVAFIQEIQPVDRSGNPVGPVQTLSGTVVGSATTRATRAATLDAVLNTPSRWIQVRTRRVSASDTDFEGSVSDEVKWRDFYACSSVGEANFGDITTVHAVTYATDGALAIKERKLNLLVTRKLPKRLEQGGFSTELYPTTNVADILVAVCRDPKLGNRPDGQVDFDNLYETAQEIRDYFGVDVAQFNYTIDNEGLSFEEIVSMIAEAIFCKAYRRGSVIRLFFEREESDSALLFNHRNKVPSSEQRTDQIVTQERFDGIEYQWVDPDTDALTSIYLPEDRSAVNAKVIESVGVRVEAQGMLQAWRAYNKLLYQDELSTFDALPEANLLILSQRFLNADNTRGSAWDGDVVATDESDPTLIQMSQPFDWGVGPYTIFLQGSDAHVEVMGVSSGGGRYLARLERAPRTAIIPRGSAYNATSFIITDATNSRRAKPFLLTEKGAANSNGTIPVTAINYDARYYQNDGDFRA